jgi:cell division protein FtsQ
MRALNRFRRAPVEAAPVRRDPAPTRWAYRMERLWLTPVFRALLRVGLPSFALAFAAGLYLDNDARRAALAHSFVELRETVEQRPEFMVRLMAVEGANPGLADAVRDIAALKLPQSSFDLDLEAARARIETLDAVAGAELRVRTGGVLEVKITEREPVIIWRRAEGLDLLDRDGRRVAMILARGDRADLPLIAGDGADRAVPEAQALIAALGPLAPRLRGLVRMGARRWDVVLDRNQRILLPEADPLAALGRLMSLDRADALLARDVLTVDLRLAARPTLRLAPGALAQMRGVAGLALVEGDL